MAIVRVSRPSGGIRDLLRAYRVLIDDEEVGSVRRGQTIEVQTPGGAHRVRAALGYVGAGDVGSEPLAINLGPADTVDLVVEPVGKPVYKPGDIAARRTSYLAVRIR
jgi:hypothetical protein